MDERIVWSGICHIDQRGQDIFGGNQDDREFACKFTFKSFPNIFIYYPTVVGFYIETQTVPHLKIILIFYIDIGTFLHILILIFFFFKNGEGGKMRA
jgi:hypothetical protein